MLLNKRGSTCRGMKRHAWVCWNDMFLTTTILINNSAMKLFNNLPGVLQIRELFIQCQISIWGMWSESVNFIHWLIIHESMFWQCFPYPKLETLLSRPSFTLFTQNMAPFLTWNITSSHLLTRTQTFPSNS